VANSSVLVLGGSGFIGNYLINILKDDFRIFVTHNENKTVENSLKLDIRDSEAVEKVFQNSNPDVVVNLCAIYKNLDFCDHNKKLVMEVNGTSLKSISKFANKFDSLLIQLSTDFVFDGKKGNYKENASIDPINYYGKSKAEAEKNILECSKKFCIARTSMVYGFNKIKPTLPDWILKEMENKKEIKLIADQYTTPTYVENLCSMLKEIIKIKYEGIIHLSGPEKLSRYEFAKKLVTLAGFKQSFLVPVNRSEFKFSKKMPKDSSLNTFKVSSMLKEKPQKVETSIKKYLGMRKFKRRS